MGSSAIGATLLRRKLAAAGVAIPVAHAAIDELPPDADIVLTHRDLTPRARLKRPEAEHISLQDFLRSPVYDQLAERLARKP
jgi:PTS system mannitol-specific IIC component